MPLVSLIKIATNMVPAAQTAPKIDMLPYKPIASVKIGNILAERNMNMKIESSETINPSPRICETKPMNMSNAY